MRVLRRSAIVAVVAGVLFGGAVPVSAAGITIDPSAGLQSDTYTIQGIELPPGLALDIHFKSPDGNVYSTAELNQVVIVDPDGHFNFQQAIGSPFEPTPGNFAPLFHTFID